MRHWLISLILASILLGLVPGEPASMLDARAAAAAQLPKLVPSDAADRMLRATARRLGPAPKLTRVAAVEPLGDYAFYLPPNATVGQPLRILVAIHGMGGNGPDFARSVVPLAHQNGWAVLAPTMPYRDYRDPELIRRDGELLLRLKALIDVLPQRTGLTFEPRALLFGFSRGSQEAHRFAFMFPESTLGLAGLSAGSYTLPGKTFVQNAQEQLMKYPYGTADVDTICGTAFNAEAARKVSYWIAVGGSDNRNEDVPRQWDRFLGINRVERAQRFVAALQQFGARAQFTSYQGVGHEVTAQMQADALGFLASLGS